MRYRKRSTSSYSPKRRRSIPLAKVRTRHWGTVSYPQGSKPVVVEIEVDEVKGSAPSVIFKEGFGYKKDSDLSDIKNALEIKAKKELTKDQKAEVSINFPRTRKKPVKFSVAGEAPLTPRVIHHPAWPPPENLVQEIKKELKSAKRRKTASDLEAMAYLNTISMAAPMSEQWCRIYFHLTYKYLKKKGWKKFEGTMGFLTKHRTLNEHDKRELEKLKAWIFKEQQKDLAERRKRARQLAKEVK